MLHHILTITPYTRRTIWNSLFFFFFSFICHCIGSESRVQNTKMLFEVQTNVKMVLKCNEHERRSMQSNEEDRDWGRGDSHKSIYVYQDEENDETLVRCANARVWDGNHNISPPLTCAVLHEHKNVVKVINQWADLYNNKQQKTLFSAEWVLSRTNFRSQMIRSGAHQHSITIYVSYEWQQR